MKRLLNLILSAGISDLTSQYHNKYIRLLNGMSVIFSCSALVFIFIFVVFGAPVVSLYLAILMLFFFCIPVLNHFGYYESARLLLILSLYGGICFFSALLGPESLVDVIYVSVLTVPFAIGGRKHSYIIYLGLILSLGLFSLYNFTGIFDAFIMEDPPLNIKFPITAFIFIMPFLVLNQLKGEQSRYSSMLESRSDEISSVNLRLKASNKKLEQTIADLQQAMSERNMLLREVHHRVKNNMQIINSLLNLQSNYSNDSHSGRILRHSRLRVNSMAMVHELLYNSRDLTRIKCDEYLRMLINHLIISMTDKKDHITFEMNTPDILMNMDTAIPLGLLVNEIVMNSLKHGFSGRDQGHIRIDVKENARGGFVMNIADNGVGFRQPDDSSPQTLGLLLMEELTGQLKGAIKKKNTTGTCYEISFRALGRSD